MPANASLFIAFRLFFNARYYYPIFAVIQLDYGLSLEQFAILNAIWAVSIVVLEVPSGALADKIGRKRMVVLAAVLMVIEMGIIAFVPLGNATIVFWAWVINRILSGAAEAAASGADEALAYDSFPENEREARWPSVLARLMRFSSMAFIFVMLTGAAVYDPSIINNALGFFGIDAEVTKEQAIRFPIYLTLIHSIGAVIVSLKMKEPPQDTLCGGETSLWSGIFKTGVWIWKTPIVFVIIFAALIHDSLVRVFLTTNSQYYRLIEIPDGAFGVIGATSAALGLIVPGIAKRLVAQKGKMVRNCLIVSALLLTGLLIVSQAFVFYGVFVVIIFSTGFGLLNFFTSHYLNSRVDSRHRATVLSFRGLALNLGFGTLSLLYAGLIKGLKQEVGSDTGAFRESLYWLPGTFLLLLIPLILYWRFKVDHSDRRS